MSKSNAPRVSLAIYRLKQAKAGTSALDGVIAADRGDDVRSTDASIDGIDECRVFAKKVEAEYPSWATFLVEAAPDVRRLLEKHAANAVVLAAVRRGVRYALAFGYGRALLDSGSIERGFGLRCALDLIAPESLSGVGIKEVDHATLFSSIQSNKRGRFDQFRVDTESSLLNGVVGWPEARQVYYSRALGSDPLHINPAITVNELPRLLDWVDSVYARRGYTANGYDWIDHIRVVRDTAVIAKLEKKLDVSLAQNSGVDVGPPEHIDYESVAAFTVVGLGRGARVDRIVLGDIQEARQTQKLTVEVVREARVKALNEDGETLKTWPAFDWLMWSGRDGGKSYILQDGLFYEIDRQFEARIDRYLARLRAIPADWPDSTAKPSEEEYEHNKLLKSALGGRALLLDKTLFSKSFRGRAKLELCDVFLRGNPNWLICSKKYDGSAAPLSHLFTQGSNAVETLLADEGFRDEVRATPGLKSSVSKNPPPPSRFGLVWLIFTKRQRRKLIEFPFFAKLSLFRHAKRAKRLGIDVRVGTRAMTG